MISLIPLAVLKRKPGLLFVFKISFNYLENLCIHTINGYQRQDTSLKTRITMLRSIGHMLAFKLGKFPAMLEIGIDTSFHPAG